MVECAGKEYLNIAEQSEQSVARLLRTFEELSRTSAFPVPQLLQVVLLAKTLRCHSAIVLLVRNYLAAESASVCVTQLEAALSAEYMGVSTERANFWMGHQNERSHPWKIRTMLDELRREDSARAQLWELFYVQLSRFKHASPTTAGLGFPMTMVGNELRITTTGSAGVSNAFWGSFMLVVSSRVLTQTAAAVAGKITGGVSPDERFSLELCELEKRLEPSLGRMFDDYSSSVLGELGISSGPN